MNRVLMPIHDVDGDEIGHLKMIDNGIVFALTELGRFKMLRDGELIVNPTAPQSTPGGNPLVPRDGAG